jgi:hypothetical protein
VPADWPLLVMSTGPYAGEGRTAASFPRKADPGASDRPRTRSQPNAHGQRSCSGRCHLARVASLTARGRDGELATPFVLGFRRPCHRAMTWLTPDSRFSRSAGGPCGPPRCPGRGALGATALFARVAPARRSAALHVQAARHLLTPRRGKTRSAPSSLPRKDL